MRDGHALSILGIELLLIGGVAALAAAGVHPGVVLAIYAALAFLAVLFRPEVQRSGARLPHGSIAALCLSFWSALPGTLFFVQMMQTNLRVCERLPLLPISFIGIFLVSPALLYLTILVSPWHASPRALNVLRLLHLVAWILGGINTWFCMMV